MTLDKQLGQDALRAVLREAVHRRRRSWSAPVVVQTLDGWRRALERAERGFRFHGFSDAARVVREILDNWLGELPPHHALPYLRQCRACKQFLFDSTRGHTKRFCDEAHKKRAHRHPWTARRLSDEEQILSVGDRVGAPTRLRLRGAPVPGFDPPESPSRPPRRHSRARG